MFDDYQALIAFAVEFHRLGGFLPRLLYAFAAQHDEYKLIFEHLLAGADLGLTGTLHYRFLVVLGNLFLLGILLVLWRAYLPGRPLEQRLLRFIPVSLLLFGLNYGETVDWAMCGLQMIPVIFFTALSLELLVRAANLQGRTMLAWTFAASCVAAWLACLASANGFLVAPVGLLVLLQMRRLRFALLWPLPFLLALAPYLYHYTVIQRTALVHPSFLAKSLFFLSLLGSAIENMHHFPVNGGSIILGAMLLAGFVWSFSRQDYRERPFWFYFSTWVLICAATVTQVRSILGADQSLNSRYKIYSDLMMICVYTFLVDRLDHPGIHLARRPMLYVAAVAFAALLCLSSDFFVYQFLKRRAEGCSAGFVQYLADPAHKSPEVSVTAEPISGPEPEFSRRVTNEAIADGLYLAPRNP